MLWAETLELLAPALDRVFGTGGGFSDVALFSSLLERLDGMARACMGHIFRLSPVLLHPVEVRRP